MFLATMMWSIGMADRDNSDGARAAPVFGGQVNKQSEDDNEMVASAEGIGPSSEAAENAIRALGNHDDEHIAENGPQEGGEEEESKEDVILVQNIRRLFLEGWGSSPGHCTHVLSYRFLAL